LTEGGRAKKREEDRKTKDRSEGKIEESIGRGGRESYPLRPKRPPVLVQKEKKPAGVSRKKEKKSGRQETIREARERTVDSRKYEHGGRKKDNNIGEGGSQSLLNKEGGG